jgi:hypothetical protein
LMLRSNHPSPCSISQSLFWKQLQQVQSFHLLSNGHCFSSSYISHLHLCNDNVIQIICRLLPGKINNLTVHCIWL